MTDTIDLLEAIGQDASLRYASTEALTHVLEEAKASAALTAAVAFGENSRLLEEFGYKLKETNHATNNPGREEEPDKEQPLDVPLPGKTPLPSGE
ncbi:MAG TPA: hypothetical protein VMA74_13170 [Dyella sp.]|uniref:hypothetical protein n=1 Tax=Dyella sp. TaxID=1869338 RepID=UPI002B56EB25|nr:hypothetical protein [Dyella sp.]HUB90669.1 hypothetical protein [Dyella sp.]